MEEQTVAEARAEIFEENTFRQGSYCPCCDQYVKIYPRQISATQAKSLIRLFQLNRSTYPIHVSKLADIHSEFGTLKFWGVIREARNEKTNTRTSGMWFITQKGIDFVKNNIQLPKYCDTYNMKRIGFSEEMVTIHDALAKKKFDYQELMGNFYEPPVPKHIKQIGMEI